MKGKSNKDKYFSLRQEFPLFTYESYHYTISEGKLDIEFLFKLNDEIVFRPKLSFPNREFYNFRNLPAETLNLFAFNLGLVELVSYWKATCSPTILIKPHILDTWQKNWWKKLYYKGLGEFFYTNDIHSEFDSFVKIIVDAQSGLKSVNLPLKDNVIVPVGGGKDSIVSLEKLKQSGKEIIPFIINPSKTHWNVIQKAGFNPEETIGVFRTIDPVLLELNSKGFLNGHTPFSAVVAFLSAFTACLSNSRFIALSNESSANEPTIPDTGINHQYSKSVEFESDFRNYTGRYINPGIEYFSFLRPLNELQIGRSFSQNEKYFDVFRSCNAGSKSGIWCGSCPKCLFTYIILSPFLDRETLLGVFNKDLFDDPELLLFFNQLVGDEEEKPFECVGTVDEVKAAVAYSIDKRGKKLPYLLRYYKDKHPEFEKYLIEFSNLLQSYDPDNFLGPEFEKIIMGVD